jgi:hypothetical protein
MFFFLFVVNHYQFKVHLSKESKNSSRNIQFTLNRKGLKAIPLDFTGNFEAGQSYEFLVTSEHFDAKDVLVVTGKYLNSITDHVFWSQEVLKVEKLEVNYMSHIDPE